MVDAITDSPSPRPMVYRCCFGDLLLNSCWMLHSQILDIVFSNVVQEHVYMLIKHGFYLLSTMLYLIKPHLVVVRKVAR